MISARTSPVSPSRVRYRTPLIRPPSSMKEVASVFIRRVNPGSSDAEAVSRSKRSHWGTIAM